MPAKPVALLFADAHLQDSAWTSRHVYGDSYYSFEQILRAANKLNVPLIGAGDLIDKAINRSGPIVTLLKAVHDLRHSFYFVQGQHELSDTPWLSAGVHCVHLDKRSVGIGPFTIFGLDYHPAEKLKPAMAEIPAGTDILIAHQVWGDFMGELALPQGYFADVPKVSTMFTGDYHVTDRRHVTGADGQPLTVISSGSTCMQDISEQADKYYHVLYDNGEIQAVALQTRPVIRLKPVLTAEHVDEVIESVAIEIQLAIDDYTHLPDHIRKPLVHIPILGELEDAPRRILNAVGDRAHVFWKPLISDMPSVAEHAEPVVREAGAAVTLLSELPEFLAGEKLSDLQPHCARLLESPDPQATLRQMKNEAIA